MKVKVTLIYWCKCNNSEYPHKYIKKPSLHGRGQPWEYRIEEIEDFCCIEMRRAYDENFIQFKTIMNRSIGGIPIGCGLAIIRTYCYEEGACENEMYIDYCPFCGEKIETEGLK